MLDERLLPRVILGMANDHAQELLSKLLDKMELMYRDCRNDQQALQAAIENMNVVLDAVQKRQLFSQSLQRR